MPGPLSDGSTFKYGAVGAVVALLVVHVLPWALALAGGADVNISVGRIIGVVLVLGVFIVGGGIVAILVGDATEPKQAIAYGLGWQGTIGGLIQGIAGGPSGDGGDGG